MWREQLDAFWDGRRGLAIGFFDSGERASALGLRPDLVVVSAMDTGFSGEAALVDVIDAVRWGPGHCIVELPQDHLFVSLRAADGSELRLALTGEKSPLVGGEWRLLLTLLPETAAADAAVFRLASLSARGDFERLAREQVVQTGVRLVWAIGQRRLVERRDGAARLVHLWPTRRVFPAYQSRIVLEPVETPAENGGDGQQAPFAIMDHWLRENGAPRVTLRIRVPDSLDESAGLLNRASVVLVMHQRRRLRDWMQEQKDAGDPTIDSLTFDDIRQAVGEPSEHPDAVESGGAIMVCNLLKLVTNPNDAEFDGFAVRRVPETNAPGLGAAIDIEFYGAALGDDVGLVSTAADVGDFGVAPVDPGGSPYVRLFRVEGDGPKPRRVGDDDVLLDEILRRAADQETAPTGAMTRSVTERAAGLRGRREKFLASLNASLARAEYPGRFDAAGAWDAVEPLLFSSFATLVATSSAAARALMLRLGGYAAYRADPSLLAAMARQPGFAETGEETPARKQDGEARSLVYRFAGACAAGGLAAAGAGLAAQIEIWRLIMQTPRSDRLKAARIELEGDDGAGGDAAAIADLLFDEAVVERAAAHFEDRAAPDEAAALRHYLTMRRDGEWTPLAEAAGTAALAARANADWKQAETDASNAAADVAPQEAPLKPAGFFAAVKGFFARGAAPPQT